MWTDEEEKRKYKAIVAKNISSIVDDVHIYVFPDVSAYFLKWLHENPFSKSFEEFTEWVVMETDWHLNGLRKGRAWAELLTPDEKTIEEFAEEWVSAEDRKSFIDGWKEFLKSKET